MNILLRLASFRFLTIVITSLGIATSLMAKELNGVSLVDIAKSRQWLKLLHYHKGFWSFRLQSQVDGSGFFIAPNGKVDPLAELEATLEALRPESKRRFGNDGVHGQCAFPARFMFLKKALGLNWKELSCSKLEEVLGRMRGRSLTYVFSTAFPNNPGSMFGHTFIRINAKPKVGQKRMELFDHGLSYAALTPEGYSGMGLVIKGLFGLYPGMFSSPLYHEKIAEYTSFESRDLWEYELDVNEEETELFIKAVWEVANNGYFDYYFFDENCAFHLLALLEIAKPNWELTDSSFFVSPVDSILAIKNVPGAIKKVNFRPSVKTQFQSRYNALSESRKAVVKELITEADSELPNDTTLLDVLDSYYKYINQRFGGHLSQEIKERQYQVQIKQSKLPAPSEVKVWADTRPDTGHRVSRVKVSHVTRDNSNNISQSQDISYKFSYHDMLDSDQGFVPYSQIDFVELTLSKLGSDEYYLQGIRFIEFQSLYPMTFYETRKSWRFSLDYSRPRFLGCDSCYQWNMDGALGLSLPVLNDQGMAYMFVGADIDYFPGDKFLLGGKFELGVITRFLNNAKVWVGVNQLTYFDPESDVRSIFLKSSLTISRDFQMRLSWESRSQIGVLDPVSVGMVDLNWYL